MKNRKLQGNVVFILVTGLSGITLPQVLRHYLELSDGITGFLMGAGIGILLVAVVKMKRSYY